MSNRMFKNQWIGSYDKDGFQIHEGDILQFANLLESCEMTVVYDSEGCCFGYTTKDSKTIKPFCAFDELQHDIFDHCVVVSIGEE